MTARRRIRMSGFRKPGMNAVAVTTYIYVNENGQLVHQNAVMGHFGTQYVHQDESTLPLCQEDWPYEIVDMRREKT